MLLAQSSNRKESSNMKEYRRPSLSVIDEKGSDDDFVIPAIKVSSCDDLDQNRNERFSSLNGLLSTFHSEGDTLKPGSDLIKKHSDSFQLGCDSGKSGSESDLSRLKNTAHRLNLGTRRPSYIEWQEKYMNRSRRRLKPELVTDPDLSGKDTLTVERKEKINQALDWLREELHEMRSQDQELARTLLTLRQDINQLKLKRSYEEHKDMLEGVKCDMEDVQEMKDICDLPIDTPENPLKRLGVTPMNISSRRFSIF
ncbi:unnamed protein product [Mytilus coruscus]|uniref:FAM167A n=1 Tax=Mytilus coruscus TaxID=42192 RepID=A0A6J8AGH6_MYTCO|nr:unnamed protein product [Mytilus coruscus]